VSAFLNEIEPLVRHFGLPGLFADIYLEALGLPLPGESIIIIASSLAALGQLSIEAVAATVFFAAIAGDNTGYVIGRRLGHPLVVRYGSRFGVTHERLAKVEDLVRRRGVFIVAIARFVAILRQLNGIAAGTAHMPWPRFFAANAVGAALWTGLWTTLAYRFGADLTILPQIWKHLSVLAMVLMAAIGLLLIAGWYIYLRRRH